MKAAFTFILTLFVAVNSFAQTFTLSGKVSDQEGNPVPFTSVYIRNTSRGTSANSEGTYLLKLAPGKYELVFNAIGFRQYSQEVVLTSNQQLDVKLATEIYELKDVLINPGAEDPAYAIMRKAIRERKTHLKEVDSYTTNVYIKGMQKLLAAPKKFLGKDVAKIGREMGLDSNRQGIIYLSESESRLSFMQPDLFREEMLSSKVSGSNRAFSFNRATDVKVNFYENYQDWEGLSNRPIISPLADNALFYYRYKYIGAATENGQPVNKIQVIPRRDTDPVFRGYIYILEDSWRLHSLDLFLTREANINFVDTLKVHQQFIPVDAKIWMPSSVRFDFTGAVLGFRFGGYFMAMYKDYDLEPGLMRENFSEVLRITPEVNKKDSSYWSQVRPIPLTSEEKNDYRKKDTLAARRESKPYLDSLDSAGNKFKPVAFAIGSGYDHSNRFKKESFHFNPIATSLFYNTVEGFGFNYGVSYRKEINSLSNKHVFFSGNIRYGFSSNALYGNLTGSIPVQSMDVGFSLGSDVLDLNNFGSLPPLGNSINSLFYEINYMKLYEKKFARFWASRRISGGFTGSVTTEWARRKSLSNSTDFTFIDHDSEEFTSNNPFNPLNDEPLFPENNSFRFELRMTYDFSKEYATYPTGRVYQPSKYPRLGLSYTGSFKNILGSDTRFELLSFDISKEDVKLGLYGKSSVYLGAGKFLNNEQLYYPDHKHFIGTRSLGYTPKINSFMFLDYYLFSTADKYFEGHFEHNFSGFITNKVPLVRKLKLQEIAGVKYLATPVLRKYTEVYFGLQYLMFRVSYGMSYMDGKRADNGFRIALQL
ncbi:carboxypeptidase-like regulatory domain-containing protein [Flavihumibacter sp. R14]|nr:carboxypeptidase-like regulatory domain-containing protein [Flavihumibacter soli]